MKVRSGFTLIELLVVISIISILSLAAIVAYSTVLKSSRDADRQTDLKVIQSALESYFNDQKYYPVSLPAAGSSFDSPGTTNIKTYLNTLPDDPDSSKDYSYEGTECVATKCKKYCLYADGESVEDMTNTSCTQAGHDSEHTIIVTPP